MRVTPKMKKEFVGEKPTIHDVNILDRSGSMAGGKYKSAVDGINEEANLLKKDENANYLITRVEFDSIGWGRASKESARILWHTEQLPLTQCPTFVGKGADGGTPLYETVAKVIERMVTVAKPGEKVLLKISTDGAENASSGEWAREAGGAARLRDLIKKVEKESGFTVTFIGTTQDIDDMVNEVSILRGNTYAHNNTAEGVKMSSLTRSAATINYSKKLVAGEDVLDNFYGKSINEEEEEK